MFKKFNYKIKQSLLKYLVGNIPSELLYEKIFENWNRWEDIAKKLQSIGTLGYVHPSFNIKNPQYIQMGDNFHSLYNLRLEAWDKYENEIFSPELRIGDNVTFNSDVHIGCINKVIIGNNALLASRIYISDHSHGRSDFSDINSSPANRKLYSKGPVELKDDVWIGEGVCILPNVTIGKNSIIGANSVVTKDIPPFSIAVGCPARVIRQMDNFKDKI